MSRLRRYIFKTAVPHVVITVTKRRTVNVNVTGKRRQARMMDDFVKYQGKNEFNDLSWQAVICYKHLILLQTASLDKIRCDNNVNVGEVNMGAGGR